MKKPLLLFILLSFFILSCQKEPEPVPEVIRSYCSIYHFLPGIEGVIWEVNEIEVPEEKKYAEPFHGAVTLETATEDIIFTVRHAGTREELASQLFQLEQNKYYNVIVGGPAEEPVLFISEIETSHPAAGMIKFQILHSIPGQGPIDLFMGDTTSDKRVLTALDHLELSDPFEVADYDARKSVTAAAHSAEYNPDSVLLHSVYNDEMIAGASYLVVVARHTWDMESNLTFWLYSLPQE